MPSELYIVGTGGLAKECAQLARQIDPDCKRWTSIVYVTDDENLLGTPLPYGSVSMMDGDLNYADRNVDVVIGVGHPIIKKKIIQKLSGNAKLNFPNLIHPMVEIEPRFVKLGIGNILTKGVIMTCDIEIGDFNLFNWNCTVGHDTTIGSYNVILPGSSISGRVKMGDSCLVGTCASIIENIVIGSNIFIGAGAVVTRSITQEGVYVGVPARMKNSQ